MGVVRTYLVQKSSLVIVCLYLKTILILLKLLQPMCLRGQKKSYTERQVPFISWRSLLNAIKAGGVKLGSRQEYIFPVDTTNLESFDMDIVNTNKICTSALLSLFGQGQTFWQKITNISDTGVCAKAHGNTGRKRSFQPEDQCTKALHDHFKALVSMGEVCATRFVSKAI